MLLNSRAFFGFTTVGSLYVNQRGYTKLRLAVLVLLCLTTARRTFVIVLVPSSTPPTLTQTRSSFAFPRPHRSVRDRRSKVLFARRRDHADGLS